MPKLRTTQIFVNTTVACEIFDCSESHLKNLQSHWKYGEHYIDLRLPSSQRAVYRYNIQKLTEWFAISPESRGSQGAIRTGN